MNGASKMVTLLFLQTSMPLVDVYCPVSNNKSVMNLMTENNLHTHSPCLGELRGQGTSKMDFFRAVCSGAYTREKVILDLLLCN